MQALSSLCESIETTFSAWEDDSIVTPVAVDGFAAIAVVNLARLTDTPSLLPVALYTCCSLGGALVDGWKREDGTIEYLSPADLKRCINARNALAKEAFSLVSLIFNPTPGGFCRTPDACRAALHANLATVLARETVADSTVLDAWTDVINEGALPRKANGYCASCASELHVRDDRERERVWDRLLEIFDVEVPNWNQDWDDEGESDGDANAGD